MVSAKVCRTHARRFHTLLAAFAPDAGAVNVLRVARDGTRKRYRWKPGGWPTDDVRRQILKNEFTAAVLLAARDSVGFASLGAWFDLLRREKMRWKDGGKGSGVIQHVILASEELCLVLETRARIAAAAAARAAQEPRDPAAPPADAGVAPSPPYPGRAKWLKDAMARGGDFGFGQERNLKPHRLAVISGLKADTIKSMLAGKPARHQTLKQIAEAFHVSLADIPDN